MNAAKLRISAMYAALLVGTGGAYALVRSRGEGLVAPPPGAGAASRLAGSVHASTLAQVLLALAVVTVASRALGWLMERRLGQPAVMGEIVAGLCLGPSLLGAVAPSVSATLLPAEATPGLGLLAKVGVVLFLFIVGLELDASVLKRSSHATIAISHASIVAPFLLGATLALWLYPRYGTNDVSFTVFSLFCGVSLSVTAFPVLARILTDRRVHRTPLGVMALACAAVDDVTAWTLLALVVGVANARLSSAAVVVPLVAAYLATIALVVRPLLGKLAERVERDDREPSHATLAVVFVAVLLSACATEAIGIHALFGAFAVGAVLPHEGRLAEGLRARLNDVVVVLLLPAFFAFTGMRTHLALVHGARDWAACLAIVGVATLGKFGGSFVAARVSGLGWRASSAIGVLMNTRGLMELIVLNIGLDMGVISPTLFAMLVIMALVTTFATTPVLGVVVGDRGFADVPGAKLELGAATRTE